MSKYKNLIWVILFIQTVPIFFSFANEKKCLILLHGLSRTSRSLNTIENEFKKSNYFVWNKTYPSTQKKIKDLIPAVEDGLHFCKTQNADSIYFVTHSMGGILVRQYFQNKSKDPILNQIKAVVMLSPPNHGSEVVDSLKNQKWFQWLNGPASLELGTDENSLPKRLQKVNLNIGIITGNVSSDPWFSHLFKGPNDGKVSVESAKLQEMKDFLVVPRGHTFIMESEEVIKNIFHFFDYGTFIKTNI